MQPRVEKSVYNQDSESESSKPKMNKFAYVKLKHLYGKIHHKQRQKTHRVFATNITDAGLKSLIHKKFLLTKKKFSKNL